MVVGAGWGRRGSWCLKGTEFRFCKMTSVLGMDGRDGGTAVQAYLKPLSRILKNDYDGKFCFMYFVTT